jgi:alanine-glyoxylate transaminase/serine-glyoxylate transaminase/serine-pyruvate transaminase
MPRPTGWHFLQTPGPSNVPGRVLRAMARPTIDHRGPEFSSLAIELFEGLRWLLGTDGPVVVYPSSGTGAWEAALVNTLSAGDRILMFETGHFGVEWAEVATRLGLQVDLVPGDWRRGVDPSAVESRLGSDEAQSYKAVAVLHNETSTGAVTDVAGVRRAIDRAGRPALLLVDTISSLGSIDYRHREWGVDVTVAASQKGLMLPPGLAFLAVSERAIEASRTASLPRSYFDWTRHIAQSPHGFFPYTPATNLLFGLRESLAMLKEEGLGNVFARHKRHGAAAREAVERWGLEVQCAVPEERSPVLTGVRVPEGHDADQFRSVALDRFNLSLGTGLGKLRGKMFRIGHLGDMNDLMILATLAGVESSLAIAGVPIRRGGVEAAMLVLEASSGAS